MRLETAPNPSLQKCAREYVVVMCDIKSLDFVIATARVFLERWLSLVLSRDFSYTHIDSLHITDIV